MAKSPRTGLRLWDRLVLLTAWLVTCGLVYVFGFYTGQGLQTRQLGREERVVRLPVTSHPPAEGQRPKEPSDLTFYEKLVAGGGAGDGGAPAVKAPAPAASQPSAAAKGSVAGGSPSSPPAKPGVSQEAPSLAATKPATPPSAAPRPSAAPESRPVQHARVTAPPTGTMAKATLSAATGTVPPAAAPLPKAAPAPVAAVEPPTASDRLPGGGWTVEANPTRDRDEAEALLGRLRSRGYDVTLERVLREGGTWYRLRVGRYPSAGQANDVMRRLRDQEGVPHAFVAAE